MAERKMADALQELYNDGVKAKMKDFIIENIDTIVEQLAGKYLTRTDVQTTYLSKSDAATTYATKTDLANVQIDTSNFAKLDSTNTFSDSITLEEPLTIVGYNNYGSNILFKVNANAAWSSEGTFTIAFTPKYQTPNVSHPGGADLIYKNSAGTSEIYLSPTSIELNINSTTYTFKSDGIYKEKTKIAG